MSINRVVIVGHVASAPRLTYNENAKPACIVTLRIDNHGQEGRIFKLFVDVFCYGVGAEVAASTLDVGMLIALEGNLSYKSALKPNGEKYGLYVVTWSIEKLTESPQDERSDAGEGLEAQGEESANAPAPKVRKPRYARWKPEPSSSN